MTKYFRNGQYVDAVNADAVSYGSEDKATANVQKASKVLPEIRAFASRYPDLSEHVTAVETAIQQAEVFEDQRDEAAANVALRTRERDSAGRAAIRAGDDPVAAEEEAESALADARATAERLERYRAASAENAASLASKAAGALQKVKRENSGTIVRERLEALEKARQEAIEAAQEAARKIQAIDVHVLRAQQAASIAPDSELSRLVRSPYDPDARRVNSTQLTVNSVVRELQDIPDRLSYKNPGGSRPTALGSSLGEAVKRTQEQ